MLLSRYLNPVPNPDIREVEREAKDLRDSVFLDLFEATSRRSRPRLSDASFVPSKIMLHKATAELTCSPRQSVMHSRELGTSAR